MPHSGRHLVVVGRRDRIGGGDALPDFSGEGRRAAAALGEQRIEVFCKGFWHRIVRISNCQERPSGLD